MTYQSPVLREYISSYLGLNKTLANEFIGRLDLLCENSTIPLSPALRQWIQSRLGMELYEIIQDFSTWTAPVLTTDAIDHIKKVFPKNFKRHDLQLEFIRLFDRVCEPPTELLWIMEFTDVASMEAAYFIDATLVDDWNNTILYYGWSSVDVVGNTVTLHYAGGVPPFDLTINDFDPFFQGNPYIVSVDDQAGILVYVGSVGISGCANLTSWNFPSLADVGDAGIANNTNLNVSSFPSLTTITGQGALGANRFINVTLPVLATSNIEALKSNSLMVSVTCPLLVDIPAAFCNLCTSLTTLSFASAQTIGESAFQGCSALTSITNEFDNVTSIGDQAFAQNAALASVSFPSAVTIGVACFQNDTKLEVVSLPACTTFDSVAGAANTMKNCILLNTLDISHLTDTGNSGADSGVFDGITGNTIDVTANSFLQTNNGGGMDENLAILDANNTVTFTWV